MNQILIHVKDLLFLVPDILFMIIIIGFLFVFQGVNAQVDTVSNSISDSSKVQTQLYKIIKTDGGELVGEIIEQDSREIFL